MIGSRRGKGLLVIPDNWEGGKERKEARMEVLLDLFSFTIPLCVHSISNTMVSDNSHTLLRYVFTVTSSIPTKSLAPRPSVCTRGTYHHNDDSLDKGETHC